MPDPQAATEVEGVLWCVEHDSMADEAEERCRYSRAGIFEVECDFRRLFVDPRPEARVWTKP